MTTAFDKASQGEVSGVFDLLVGALEAAGYPRWGFWPIPEGGALASSLEKIDEEGRPLQGQRWSTERRGPFQGFRDFLDEFFFCPPGRWRLTMFALTSAPLEFAEPLSGGAARQLELHARPMSGEQLRALPVRKDVQLWALVYEFRKRRGDEEMVPVMQPSVGAEDHLRLSGVAAGLARSLE